MNQKNLSKVKKSKNPRSTFFEYCNNFPVDYFQIPRPLRNPRYGSNEISDSDCVFMALSLLGVPHESDISIDLEPVGWLIGPHLLQKRLNRDWSLAFCGEPLRSDLQINPWLVVTDSVVQLALAVLRFKSEQGTPKESRLAKQILIDLGLNLFIPNRSKKKRTENLSLRHYQNRPEVLATAVMLYEHIIKDFLKGRYEVSVGGLDEKENDISSAFQYVFNRSLSEDLFFEGERDRDLTSIALTFIHYETNAPYESLYKLYYATKNDLRLSEILEQLDKITNNSSEKRNKIIELKQSLLQNQPPI